MTQSLRPSKQAPKVSFKEGFKLWLNSWRPSQIKKTWQEEQARVGFKVARVNQQVDKLMNGDK